MRLDSAFVPLIGRRSCTKVQTLSLSENHSDAKGTCRRKDGDMDPMERVPRHLASTFVLTYRVLLYSARKVASWLVHGAIRLDDAPQDHQ